MQLVLSSGNSVGCSAFTAAVLLLLAGCASVPEPAPVPVGPTEFENVTEASCIKSSGGTSCAWSDYNGDGFPDVMTANGLFRNNGNGTFALVDTGPRGEGIWADFDNDGRLDFFTATGAGAMHRNLGNDSFEAVPFPGNPHPAMPRAACADADSDGWLELYLTTYETKFGGPIHHDLFYKGSDGGALQTPVSLTGDVGWAARGANWADFDNDGDVDLYVSNYRLMPNQLWVNDGRGAFEDQAKARGVYGVATAGREPASAYYPAYEYTGHTIGSCWGDLNNDGNLDLVVVNFSHPPAFQNRIQVCINSGPPGYTFTNINAANAAGIYWQESYAKGSLGDYDNDGDLDLYVTTVYPRDRGDLFENDGTGKFTAVGDAKNLRTPHSYQVAWADFDSDGHLDLFVADRLFRNKGNRHNWVKIKVQGGAGSNHAAIGARVRLTAGELVQIREVCGGNSANQDPLTLHFGLGDFSGRAKVEVWYPSGKYLTKKLKPGETHVLEERRAGKKAGVPRSTVSGIAH